MVPPKFNTKRFATRFKKKHVFYESKLEHSEVNEAIKNFNRLPEDVYDLGLSRTCHPPSILRPLRNKISELEQLKQDEYITDNRIIDMGILGTLMSDSYKKHLAESPKCISPVFKFPSTSELCQGLGCYVEVRCTRCGFSLSKRPLSKQVTSNKRGRRPFELNLGLGQYMANSEVSLTSVTKLISILNIRCPNEKTMLDLINKACKVNTKLALDQLDQNKSKLRMIIDHMPSTSTEKAIIAADTVYNNAARGANRQPGTQSSTPFVEMTTKKNLIIGIEVHTQICNVCGLGLKPNAGFHKGCIRNYPSPGPLSQVEKRATKDFLTKLQHGTLKDKVTHFLSDACKQIATGKNVEKILCKQHVQRAQRRKFYRIAGELDQGIFGPSKDKNKNKNALSHTIVNRCSKELTRARQVFTDDELFYEVTQKIRHNIVKCLAGFHAGCDKASLVCRPKRGRTSTDEVNLSIKDMVTIQSVIDYRYLINY